VRDEDRLENLIGPENIKKMLNANVEEAGGDKELIIYEVDEGLLKALHNKDSGIASDVQTYLARYPLAEMPLNLKEHVDKAMETVNEERLFTIPETDVPSGDIFYLTEAGPIKDGENGYNEPFVKIPLDDMAKWVKSVEKSSESGSIFGLEIEYSAELANNLELRIPGLGIPWMKGKPVVGKLRYYDESGTKTIFYPQAQGSIPSDLSSGALLVYARISASFTEQPLTPKMIFNWKKAIINTKRDDGTDGPGSFTGDYPLNNTLSAFLGEGVSFNRVDGYIYMSGMVSVFPDPPVSASVLIDILNSEGGIIDEQTDTLQNVTKPEFPDSDIFTIDDGKILLDQNLMSLKNKEHLNLSKALEANSKTLQVAVVIDEFPIYEDKVEDEVIKLDLLLLLPLDLKVKNEIPAAIAGDDIRAKYVKLDLGDSLNDGMGEDDLLGRKEGEDNYLKYLEYVEISLKYSNDDINIIDPSRLGVLVTTTNGSKLLEFNDNKASIKLDGDFLNVIPFNPQFTVLLKKDDNKDFGSFKVLRPAKPSFDFKLYIEAKASLEYTMDL